MKRKISLFLVATMLLMLVIPSLAQNKSYKTKIDEAIAGYKNGSSTVFSADVLSSAGQGAEWLAISAKRAGVDDNYSAYLNSLETYIATNLNTPEKRRAANATDLHRIALAIDATGGDASNFFGINFISEGIYNRYTLEEEVKTGTLGKQGTNGFVWGLIALDSKERSIPTDAFYSRDQIITAILSSQKSDGGFSFDGKASDNDFTATTITALAPYYNKNSNVKTAVDKALNFLLLAQQADGDFKNSDYNSEEWGNYPGAPNSNTTAQVLTALSSLGIDCQKDNRFIKNGKTILDGIYKYQKSNGTFAFDAGDVGSAGLSFGNEQPFYALVAYNRLSNNNRNLFDFKAESGNASLKIKVDGKVQEIDFDKSQLTYKVVLPENVNEIAFASIPLSPYETSDVALNSIKTFTDNKIEFTITGKYNKTTYSIIKTVETKEASVGDEINKLPEVLADSDIATVQKLLTDYEAMSMSEREKVSNYSELQVKYLTYIQGKDLNYVTSGTTPEGNKYTITISGKDIVNPVAFDTRIVLQSENEKAIKDIHENAFIISFLHSGELPGKTQIKIETGLEDGEYELHFFNGKSGEKIQDVSIANSEAEFKITHCSDYYLAKKAKQIKNTSSASTGDNGFTLPIVIAVVALLGIAVSVKKLQLNK